MQNEVQIMSLTEASKRLNDMTYTDYFFRLMLMARSVFKWENLPEGLKEEWIERFLFTEGRCLFYYDKTLGFMVAKCNPAGQLNYYDEPTLLRPYGTNYMGKPLQNYEECILIKNNDMMIPTTMTINLFAIRLAEISRTIDTNIQAQKTPILIKCTDKQRYSLKQVYSKYDGNAPVIFADRSLDIDGLEVLKTDAPIVFDKLQIQKHSIWNEAMTFMGINNANQDKRERLVDDEVQANNEQIELSAAVMLRTREQACEEINRLFGTNIKVSVRSREEIQKMLERGCEEDLTDDKEDIA